jgi:hypothetical protein
VKKVVGDSCLKPGDLVKIHNLFIKDTAVIIALNDNAPSETVILKLYCLNAMMNASVTVKRSSAARRDDSVIFLASSDILTTMYSWSL